MQAAVTTNTAKYHYEPIIVEMGDQPCIEADRIETLADLPPSAKLVFKSLEYAGELTQKELAAESRLSKRTVRSAINTLEENDIVTSRINFEDTRQDVYSIHPRLQNDDHE